MSPRLGLATVNSSTNTTYVDLISAQHRGAEVTFASAMSVGVGVAYVNFAVKRNGKTYKIATYGASNSFSASAFNYLINPITTLPLVVDTSASAPFTLFLDRGDVLQVASNTVLTGAQAVDVFAKFDDKN